MVTYEGSSKYFLLRYPRPGKAWQKVRLMFPPDWDTARITRLRIGVNALSDRLDFQIRNLKIHLNPAK